MGLDTVFHEERARLRFVQHGPVVRDAECGPAGDRVFRLEHLDGQRMIAGGSGRARQHRCRSHATEAGDDDIEGLHVLAFPSGATRSRILRVRIVNRRVPESASAPEPGQDYFGSVAA